MSVRIPNRIPSLQDLKQRFKSSAAAGYLVSLLIHLILMILASIVIIEGIASDRGISTLLSQSETEEVEFEGIVDTSLDLSGGEDEDSTPPQLQIIEAESELPREILPPAIAAGLGSGPSSNQGNGFQFSRPKSGRVVTKGSFSAWTVPEDPDPGQDYLIVIQIVLPDRIKRYSIRDLSGQVVGTDGYLQHIPGDYLKTKSARRKENLPIKDNRTQLIIPVPGAERLVKDTIEIRSRRLKENQTLEIVF